MTDQLEPFRRLARSLRFAPPAQLPERHVRLDNQPSLHLVSQNHLPQKPKEHLAEQPLTGPALDPTEYAANLVKQAVSKHTVLPVTNSYQQNIGDRISHLSTPKAVTPILLLPKIPAPDPNWVPPKPVENNYAIATPAIPQSVSPALVETIITPVEEIQPEIEAVATPVEAIQPEIFEEVATEVEPTASVEEIQPEIEAVVTEVEEIQPEIEEVATEVEPTAPALEEIQPEIEAVATEVEATAPSQQVSEELEAAIASPPEVPATAETETESNAKPDDFASSAATLEVVTPEPEIAIPEVQQLVPEETVPTVEPLQIICPKCGSTNLRKNGHLKGRQKYACKDCGRQFVTPDAPKAEIEAQPQEDLSASVKTEELSQPAAGFSANAAKTSKPKAKKKPAKPSRRKMR